MTTDAQTTGFYVDPWKINVKLENVRSTIEINGIEYRLVDPASTVVLDLDNPDDVQRFSDALNHCDGVAMWDAGHASNVLRSLLPSPTPPEPNGLGAVVLTEGVDAWVRVTGAETPDGWRRGGTVPTGRFLWEHLPAGARRVLSHGVGCSCGAPDCNGGDQ